MSSRQLRKLQKQKEREELLAHAPTETAESGEDETPVKKLTASRFSGFAALENEEEQEQGDRDGHDNEGDELVGAAEEPFVEPDRAADTPKSSSKKSKKNKKKTKRQQAAPVKGEAALQSGPDEIDQALMELERSKKSGEGIGSDDDPAKPYERVCNLLSINLYHLKVINEMRNLFGREAMTAAQMEEEQEQVRPGRRRRPPTMQRAQELDMETFLRGEPGKSLPEVALRRNPFVSGKETWPVSSPHGLTMEQVKEEGVVHTPGTIEFRFAHELEYQNLEMMFHHVASQYDPIAMVQYVRHHPYMISGLTQASRIAKHEQNWALAADLCERALFSFGRVSLSAFRQKLERGQARLSFKRPENRQFLLAGYHHLKNLIMRGTYRTALEWSKLLLSVEHADHYGIIHFIHPLAIQAHESEWFMDLCNSQILDLDLAVQDAQDYIKQTLVLAKLQQNDTAGAKALLVDGMERLPWLYSHLFKSLNLDVSGSIWGTQPRNQQEELHTHVYVHQTKALWDNVHAITLLKEAANEAKKMTTFPPPPPVTANFARFVYLLEIPSLIGSVPRELIDSAVNWEFDPLPPPFHENVFSYDTQKIPWERPPSVEGLAPRWARRDHHRLVGILRELIRTGAPMEIREEIIQAMEVAERGSEDSDDDIDDIDDEDGDNDDDAEMEEAGNGHPIRGIASFFQTVRDLINVRGAVYDLPGDDIITGGMPGGWHEEDSADNELPPLLRTDDSNDDDGADDGMPNSPE
ncbi:DUF654-domain-containing protein [Hypoxylon crocopeplum]|nr:DUF654-domain-containing protein [Hypoxylon crocopeplum]